MLKLAGVFGSFLCLYFICPVQVKAAEVKVAANGVFQSAGVSQQPETEAWTFSAAPHFEEIRFTPPDIFETWEAQTLHRFDPRDFDFLTGLSPPSRTSI